MTNLMSVIRGTIFTAFFVFASCSWAGDSSPPKSIPGATSEDRLAFIAKLDDGAPWMQQYYKLAIIDDDSHVRARGAYLLHDKSLSKIVPILLRLITTDPSTEVRTSAALNLHCQFTCNGAQYSLADVRTFESSLPLLHLAIRDESAGRYIVEILNDIWCQMKEKSRVSVTYVLQSDLPYGRDTVSINELAKELLKRYSNQPCSHAAP